MKVQEEFEQLAIQQQFKQLAIELVAIPILIIDVLAARIKDTKVSTEIPQGPTNIIFLHQSECITEPIKKYLMGSLVIATTLSAMYTNSLPGQLCPWCHLDG